MIIKVCGMRNTQNIREVISTGIDWIGFIFYPKSPRYAGDFLDNKLIKSLSVNKVGVFVNESVERILETAQKFNLDLIQLHGNESPKDCDELHKNGYRVIKTLSIEKKEDLNSSKLYESVVDYFLFDTKSSNYGGSGKCFDWSILSYYKNKTSFLLSGGIKPESAEEIKNLHHSQFYGIDLNSGFEIEPGLKDAEKINEFINNIKTK